MSCGIVSSFTFLHTFFTTCYLPPSSIPHLLGPTVSIWMVLHLCLLFLNLKSLLFDCISLFFNGTIGFHHYAFFEDLFKPIILIWIYRSLRQFIIACIEPSIAGERDVELPHNPMNLLLSLHHLILILAMSFCSQNDDWLAWEISEDFSDELESIWKSIWVTSEWFSNHYSLDGITFDGSEKVEDGKLDLFSNLIRRYLKAVISTSNRAHEDIGWW